MLFLQIIIIFFSPYFFLRLSKTTSMGKWLSPVVLSYLLGIVLANVSFFTVLPELAKQISEGAIVIAIPLLLFSTDLKSWIGNARTTLLSFACCLGAGVMSSIVACHFFGDMIDTPWMVSGMLVGVYTGGTPNLQAIGLALDAPENTYILLNAADILCSGIYLVLLTSILHSVLGYFLPNFSGENTNHDVTTQQDKEINKFSPIDSIKGVSLAIGVLALSFGLWFLFSQYVNQTAFIMLMLTTLSVLASLIPAVRSIPGTFETGEYLLLVFCVAIGMLSDFDALLQGGGAIIKYTAIVIAGAILMHYLLSAIFRIDRDTTMIISTASIFGPAFVGQVASVIGNRSLVFSGMATGVVGYAVGNYLGLAVAYLLK